MRAIAEVSDERAFLHRNGEVVRIEFAAGADPPGAGEHCGVQRAWMHMRTTEPGAALEQHQHLHKDAALVRIAGEVCDPEGAMVAPGNPVGWNDGRRRRVSACPGAAALGDLDTARG